MSFDSLGLSEPLIRAVRELGYTTPTPIQRQAIPAVLEGGDLLAGAQTGTGKTAGFTLPILERLSRLRTGSGKPHVRALILTPTRELAAQVEESVRSYGKYLKLRSTVMFGGVGINPQIDALKRGVEIVVATPGRLLDHIQQKTLDLSRLEILVLDEADRMLDMGFIHDIKRVLKHLPAERQNLLFSATFSDEIKALADGLLDSPALIEVARRNTTAETVAQKIHPVDRDRKRELLAHLIQQYNWFQVLVFTRTKHGANRLAEQLTKDGISALAIHGNKSQSARTRALTEFKDSTLQVLVATDIAARGIDIDQLPHVVNYDLPNVPEDYVHRIGRTGRAGATGEAVSLVCVDEHQLLRDIERLIKRELPREVIAGFEPDPDAKPEPILRRGQQARGERSSPPRAPRGSGAPARSGGQKPSNTKPGAGAARSSGTKPTGRAATSARARDTVGDALRSGGRHDGASKPVPGGKRDALVSRPAQRGNKRDNHAPKPAHAGKRTEPASTPAQHGAGRDHGQRPAPDGGHREHAPRAEQGNGRRDHSPKPANGRAQSRDTAHGRGNSGPGALLGGKATSR